MKDVTGEARPADDDTVEALVWARLQAPARVIRQPRVLMDVLRTHRFHVICGPPLR